MNKKIKKQLRLFIIFSIIFLLITQSLTLISPLIMKNIIDDYIPNKNIDKLVIGILFFIFIPLMYTLLNVTYNYFTIKYARNKGNEISIQILKNIINQKKDFFDKYNSVELLTYSSKEAVSYINFWISDFSRFIVSIIISVIVLIIICFINPFIGLLQLLYIPILLLPSKFLGKKMTPLVKTVVDNNAKISQIRSDIIKGIEYVKTMRLEDKKISEVDSMNKKIVNIWGKVTVIDSLTGIWSSGFASLLFTGLTFGLGSYMIISQTPSFPMTVGLLVSLLGYTSKYYSNVNSILSTNLNLKKKNAENEKLFSFYELIGEEDEKNKKNLTDFNKININDCSFSYNDEKEILSNITLEIPKGTWVGIVGESGSGKSTLLNLILKIYSIEDNMIFFDGNDINDLSCFSIRDNITKVSQDIFMFPGTLRDNILLINDKASDAEINDAMQIACLNEYIKKLPNGLDTPAGEAGKLMSGGEKQRFSLVQSLLTKKRILLLDEITSNLDMDTESAIRDNLNNLVKNEGYTIVSVSHRIEFLQNASIIYEIKNGKIHSIQ